MWRIVICRMSSHPATRAYVARRSKEGLSKKEIIRCVKRYVAREVYPYLRPPADAMLPGDGLTRCAAAATCWPRNDPSAVPGTPSRPADIVT